MRESLYPVPQGPTPAVRPSRLLRVPAAEVTSKGILRGRDQAPLPLYSSPQLLMVTVVAAAAFVSREVLRGRRQPAPLAARRSVFFGLPQVVPAAGTGTGLLLSDQRNRLVRGG